MSWGNEREDSPYRQDKGSASHVIYGLMFLALLCITASYVFLHGWPPWDVADKEQARTAPPLRYFPPALDPHGNPWPLRAGYLLGTPLLNYGGKAAVTVINNGSSRLHGHLVAVNRYPNIVVRQFFIPRGHTFRMDRVEPGTYKMRFHELDTGSMWEGSKTLDVTLEMKGNAIVSNGFILRVYAQGEGNMNRNAIPLQMMQGRR